MFTGGPSWGRIGLSPPNEKYNFLLPRINQILLSPGIAPAHKFIRRPVYAFALSWTRIDEQQTNRNRFSPSISYLTNRQRLALGVTGRRWRGLRPPVCHAAADTVSSGPRDLAYLLATSYVGCSRAATMYRRRRAGANHLLLSLSPNSPDSAGNFFLVPNSLFHFFLFLVLILAS